MCRRNRSAHAGVRRPNQYVVPRRTDGPPGRRPSRAVCLADAAVNTRTGDKPMTTSGPPARRTVTKAGAYGCALPGWTAQRRSIAYSRRISHPATATQSTRLPRRRRNRPGREVWATSRMDVIGSSWLCGAAATSRGDADLGGSAAYTRDVRECGSVPDLMWRQSISARSQR
jgi:hypothetical protein